MLKLQQAGATQLKSIPFIRRHNKARARSPCRMASAYYLDHTVFARSRDPHDVEAHCRFVEKPRGTDR